MLNDSDGNGQPHVALSYPVIGVLGGMGPRATTDFMLQLLDLTPASRDQDYPAVVAVSNPQIPDRTAAILRGAASPLPIMLQSRDALVAAGASVIAIPCNTAHYWYEDLKQGCRVPILHIAEAVFAQNRDIWRKSSTVGLLATPATIAAGIYQKRFDSFGVRCVYPKELEPLMRAVGDAKIGRRTEAQSILLRLIEELRAADCRSVILGCTELPMILRGLHNLDVNLIDSAASLAKACLTEARAHGSRPGG